MTKQINGDAVVPTSTTRINRRFKHEFLLAKYRGRRCSIWKGLVSISSNQSDRRGWPRNTRWIC